MPLVVWWQILEYLAKQRRWYLPVEVCFFSNSLLVCRMLFLIDCMYTISQYLNKSGIIIPDVYITIRHKLCTLYGDLLNITTDICEYYNIYIRIYKYEKFNFKLNRFCLVISGNSLTAIVFYMKTIRESIHLYKRHKIFSFITKRN